MSAPSAAANHEDGVRPFGRRLLRALVPGWARTRRLRALVRLVRNLVRE